MNDFLDAGIDRGAFGEAEQTAEEEIEQKRMQKIMTENLSGSQLDLVIHGEENLITPEIKQQTELNQMFIETERNGARNNLPKSNSSDQVASKTETSCL